MGLDDRDYMRERHRRNFDQGIRKRNPFTPPQEGRSYLVIVAWWIVVAWVLYVAYGWMETRQQKERLAREHATSLAVQQQLRAQQLPPPVREREPRIATAQTPAPEQRPPARPAAFQPTQPEENERARAPTTGGTIYLCKSYDGGMFWAASHCSTHRALIDRIASVPPGLPFEQQVHLAQQHRQSVEQTVYAAPAPAAAPDGAAAHRAECKALDARVEQLDAMARQPQSAQMQDWIRGERKTARDRQFRIRC